MSGRFRTTARRLRGGSPCRRPGLARRCTRGLRAAWILKPGQRRRRGQSTDGHVGELLPVGGELSARVKPPVDPVHRAEDSQRGEFRVDIRADQSLLLPSPDQAAEHAPLCVLTADDLCLAVRRERLQFVEEDRCLLQVPEFVVDVADDHVPQPLQRVTLACGQ